MYQEGGIKATLLYKFNFDNIAHAVLMPSYEVGTYFSKLLEIIGYEALPFHGQFQFGPKLRALQSFQYCGQ
jgi:hypothetical protein